MKKVSIGITGGGGFLGGHLKKALEKIPGARVASFDYPSGNLLSENRNPLRIFVKGKDIIVHVAAVMRASDYPLIAGNVVATHNLLEAVRKFNKKAKVIFISSSAVDANPETAYGGSKKLAELLVEDFSHLYGRTATVLRLTNVFGEGSKPFYNTVVATFCHQIARGKSVKINRKGASLMLLYVGDAVREIVREIYTVRKKPFHFRRVYTKNVISLKDLARLLYSFHDAARMPRLDTKFKRDLFRMYRSYLPIKTDV